jgi:hypothetical protein
MLSAKWAAETAYMTTSMISIAYLMRLDGRLHLGCMWALEFWAGLHTYNNIVEKMKRGKYTPSLTLVWAAFPRGRRTCPTEEKCLDKDLQKKLVHGSGIVDHDESD